MITTSPAGMTRRAVLGATAGLTAGLAVPAAARAESDSADTGSTGSAAVEAWIADRAVDLDTIDPEGPLDDLRPLLRGVAGATVVGIGEPTHNLAEVSTLKHRVVRFLVERCGVRTLIWEDDWSLGLLIDEYVRTGAGDLDELIPQLSYGSWQNRQVADVITWLRRHNVRHPRDQVRFVGAEHYATRPFVYDRLATFLTETAPDLSGEARKLIEWLRPVPETPIGRYAQWYFEEVDDKQPYLDRTRRLRRIVARATRHRHSPEASLARQTARQIENFHLHYSLPYAEIPTFRDAGAAGTIRWWLEHSRTRAAYWAATAHTSRAAGIRFSSATGDVAYTPVGHHLDRRYGNRYRVIGLAYQRGEYRTADGLIDLPAPLSEWYEHRFRELGRDQALLDLDRHAPAAVRRWLAAPFRARGLPEEGTGSTVTGGTLADWFDVIIHRREVSPVDPYP